MSNRFFDHLSRTVQTLLFGFLLLSMGGCAFRSLSSDYIGPTPRSQQMLDYYALEHSYTSFEEEVVNEGRSVTVKQILLESPYGPITVDFYSHKSKTDDLVLVFPMLGGRMELAIHFAEYLSEFGVDAAIVHRNNDFKKPENFLQFEDIARTDVLKSKLVIDFFEKTYRKKDFGTFGVSKGAVSAAIAAGVDPRLKHNVFALGGSDIVGLFRESDERKIRRYVEKASGSQGISEEKFYEVFGEQIKTDPKFLAKHIDARNTLMILGVFDSTVPVKYGYQLREQVGNPQTIYLPAGHRTSALFMQYVSLVPPATSPGVGLFPVDYLESETLDFYRDAFGHGGFDFKLMLIRALQAPINLVVEIFR